ncbi:hypothetical protein HK405_001366, partial [Cladochytrium tenue]
KFQAVANGIYSANAANPVLSSAAALTMICSHPYAYKMYLESTSRARKFLISGDVEAEGLADVPEPAAPDGAVGLGDAALIPGPAASETVTRAEGELGDIPATANERKTVTTAFRYIYGDNYVDRLEASSKMLIAISLVRACVLAGDKVLVFGRFLATI